MENLRIRAVRAGMDLSQEKLTELVGVTCQVIGTIEAGKYNPILNLCVAIRKALYKTLDGLSQEEQQETWRSERTEGKYGYDG